MKCLKTHDFRRISAESKISRGHLEKLKNSENELQENFENAMYVFFKLKLPGGGVLHYLIIRGCVPILDVVFGSKILGKECTF